MQYTTRLLDFRLLPVFPRVTRIILLPITRICYVFIYLFKYARRVIFFFCSFFFFEKYEKLFRSDKFRVLDSISVSIHLYRRLTTRQLVSRTRYVSLVDTRKRTKFESPCFVLSGGEGGKGGRRKGVKRKRRGEGQVVRSSRS